MSREALSRERGVVLHCDADGCDCRYVVAIIRVRPTRAAAAREGWSRWVTGKNRQGGATVNRTADFCPAHEGSVPRWIEPKPEASS